MSSLRLSISDRLERVLVLAHDEADGLGHGYVLCQHLLYALSLEPRGIASEVLSRLGVASEDIANRLAAGEATHDRIQMGSIDLSDEANASLDHASQVATRWGDATLDTEHLLYSLSSSDNSAVELLKELKVESHDVITEIERLRKVAPQRAIRDEATHAYRFTLDSAWVLSLAADFARQFNSPRVMAIHLLIAMLEVDGPVKGALKNTLQLGRSMLDRYLHGPTLKTPGGRIPVDGEVQLIFGYAIGEAWNRGHLAVTPVHIALAMARSRANSALDALADAGVSVHDFQEAIEGAMRPPAAQK